MLLASNTRLRQIAEMSSFYDPLTSFEPICQLVNSPTVIVVNAESPYRTLADLLDAARAKPGEVTMASTGIFQVAIEQLKRAAKANLTYLPYPGNAPAANALLQRGLTGHCAAYQRLGFSTALRLEPDFDTVSRASDDSFPASDPPSWTPVVGPAARD